MSKKLTTASSWRREVVEVKAGSHYEIDFLDTKPNTFYAMNRGDNTVYVGITNIPSKKDYEFKVESLSSKVFGRPFGTSKLYLFNPSSTDVFMDVYSYDGDFDINVLKDLSVNINGSGGSGGSTFDGIIQGFSDKTSLPSGNNLIGRVGVHNPKEVGNWSDEDVISVIQYLQNMLVNSADIEHNLTDIIDTISNLNLPWTNTLIAQLLETIENLKVATTDQVKGSLKHFKITFTGNTDIVEIPNFGLINEYFDSINYIRTYGCTVGFFLLDLDKEWASIHSTRIPIVLKDGESINNIESICTGVEFNSLAINDEFIDNPSETAYFEIFGTVKSLGDIGGSYTPPVLG